MSPPDINAEWECSVLLTQSLSAQSEAKKLLNILQCKPKCKVNFSLVSSFHFMSSPDLRCLVH